MANPAPPAGRLTREQMIEKIEWALRLLDSAKRLSSSSAACHIDVAEQRCREVRAALALESAPPRARDVVHARQLGVTAANDADAPRCEALRNGRLLSRCTLPSGHIGAHIDPDDYVWPQVAALAAEGETPPAPVADPAPSMTCGTCVHRGEVTGSCMLDVLDPEGQHVEGATIKNWRNRETFGCRAWELAALADT